MNADRHALLAALEYSAMQEREIRLLQEQMGHVQGESRDLRRRLREAREALSGRDKPSPEYGASPRPMGMTPVPGEGQVQTHTPLKHPVDENNAF